MSTFQLPFRLIYNHPIDKTDEQNIKIKMENYGKVKIKNCKLKFIQRSDRQSGGR